MLRAETLGQAKTPSEGDARKDPETKSENAVRRGIARAAALVSWLALSSCARWFCAALQLQVTKPWLMKTSWRPSSSTPTR